ncbi:MAG: NAD(P)-dependent oxidoreductase [Rhodospirillales bacterium]|nr:NAD(P)-dependent oxidoreductase [Rhodospirillales bacterium]MDH3965873.1 NAD(P)-dependent oxidoreductase [Rhodospirillales bacterium]
MVKSVALTGATGFIGRHLVESLLAAGLQVRALCRHPEKARLPAGVTVIEGALENDASLARLVEGADALVHCAGLIKAAASKDLHRVNANGTARLVQACALQPRPPRLIFLSSLAARHPELSDYAASKRRAEEELAQQAKGVHWIALRPPAVYGPGDRETFQLFRLLRHGLLPTPALESARISLIYVEDLCEAIGTLLSASIESGSLFEIRDACEEGYSWRAVAEAGGRHIGRKITCVPVPRSLMRAAAVANHSLSRITGHVPRISPGKVRELYHDDWVCRDNPLTRLSPWRPKVGLDEGMRLTLNWYEDHRWL